MERIYPTFKDWAVAFESAAYAQLAYHVTGEDYSSYRVCAEPCPKHGPGCARAVYGCLLDHVAWAAEDPCLLAGRLVATMLPPPARPSPEAEGRATVKEAVGAARASAGGA